MDWAFLDQSAWSRFERIRKNEHSSTQSTVLTWKGNSMTKRALSSWAALVRCAVYAVWGLLLGLAQGS